MKLSQTDHTTTTLDLAAGFDRNIHGGSPLRMRAIVATVERGMFHRGAPDEQTRADHAAALARFGWPQTAANTHTITHGLKTQITLMPEGGSVVAG